MFASRVSLTVSVAAYVGACASSPPVEFFTLEPIDTHGPTPPSSNSVQVTRVHVPPALDRKQMVRHDGPYRLDISDQHRWSAPFDEMVRRVLSQDLLRMLPADSVVLPEEPATAATQKIVVDILEFAPDPAGTIQFEASWSLLSPNSHELPHSRYVRLSERADPKDTADQVRAMSRILDQLASQMAHALAATH
jgi:uncharacterized lipoprotein YmbA